MFTLGVKAAADVTVVEGVDGTVTTPPPSGTPLKSSFRPTRNQKGQSLQNVSLAIVRKSHRDIVTTITTTVTSIAGHLKNTRLEKDKTQFTAIFCITLALLWYYIFK